MQFWSKFIKRSRVANNVYEQSAASESLELKINLERPYSDLTHTFHVWIAPCEMSFPSFRAHKIKFVSHISKLKTSLCVTNDWFIIKKKCLNKKFITLKRFWLQEFVEIWEKKSKFSCFASSFLDCPKSVLNRTKI